MRWLQLIGFAVGVGYGLTCALLWALQDAMIFFPPDHTRAQLDAWAANEGVRPFTIEAEDGVQLYGWHRQGDGTRALVFFHGNGGSVTAVPWFADQLPGIDVFGIDYRGYPGSEGTPSEAGFVRDARALWAHLLKLGFTPDQVVLHGQSMGGGVVHHLLMEAEPAGAVFDSTFWSIEELAGGQVPFLPVSWLLSHPFRSDLRAPKVGVRTLVMHGTDDTLIPVSHGRRLAKAHPRATYLELPNHGHNAWTLDRPEAMAVWRQFLEEVWPPVPEPEVEIDTDGSGE